MSNDKCQTEQQEDGVQATELVSKQNNPLNDKSYELMLKGRSLNKDDKFNQDAFDLLTRSIKLNPNLIESWIELSECYQKKSDFEGAIICLESALKNCDKPDKLVLRNLSACMRQRPVDSQETKISALLKSLDLSKQALKIDLEDAHSYYNLAKAYMCLFFATECVDETLIRMSRSAFEKAISSSGRTLTTEKIPQPTEGRAIISGENITKERKPLKEQSDFLFNYATVLIYMQEFQTAARLLESASRNEPEWAQPKELLESLHDYIRQIKTTLNDLTKNAKKSSRRYKKCVDALENVSPIEQAIIPDELRLRKCSSIELKAITIKELINQRNASEKVTSEAGAASIINILHIKLLFTINYNQAMYLTFIAIDKDYSFTVVTIHNLSPKYLPSNRDVITFIEPKMDYIEVTFGTEESIAYNRINIKYFKEFYINGRRISVDQVAKPQIKVSMMADQEDNQHSSN